MLRYVYIRCGNNSAPMSCSAARRLFAFADVRRWNEKLALKCATVGSFAFITLTKLHEAVYLTTKTNSKVLVIRIQTRRLGIRVLDYDCTIYTSTIKKNKC